MAFTRNFRLTVVDFVALYIIVGTSRHDEQSQPESNNVSILCNRIIGCPLSTDLVELRRSQETKESKAREEYIERAR